MDPTCVRVTVSSRTTQTQTRTEPLQVEQRLVAIRGTAAAVRALSERHEKDETSGRPLLAGAGVIHEPPELADGPN